MTEEGKSTRIFLRDCRIKSGNDREGRGSSAMTEEGKSTRMTEEYKSTRMTEEYKSTRMTKKKTHEDDGGWGRVKKIRVGITLNF